MAGIDCYRAQKIIFERYLAPQLAASYKEIREACSIELSYNVRTSLRAGLYKGHRDLLTRMVEADLKLFQKRRNEKDRFPSNNILYVKLSRKKEIALAQALAHAHADDIKAFSSGGKPTRTSQEAYNYYCEFVLGTAHGPGGKHIEWFFKRNLIAELLLRKSFLNFVTNVVDCLGRINKDIEALQTCFLEGKQIRSIRNIVSTGSYSQRGGKQVLFLDFAWDEGPHQVKRIVYKPSDVEIDYRIIGNNTEAVRGFLEAHANDPGYPKPNQSLSELINSDAAFEKINTRLAKRLSLKAEELSIPTYVVLPRNPGSKRREKNGKINIRKSYGYLEYLAHEPRRPPGAITSYLKMSGRWQNHPKPDWITRGPSDVSVCMRTWGRLAAMAYVFLATDLHHDNRRVRARRAHIIDLEIALGKPMGFLKSTFVFEHLDKAQHRPGANVVVRFSADDSFEGPLLTGVDQPDPVDATDQLYLVDSSLEVSRPIFSNPKHAPQCGRGIKDVLQVLASSDHSGELSKWIKDSSLGRAIVRDSLQDNMAARLHAAIPAILDLRPGRDNQNGGANIGEMLAGYWDATLKNSRKDKIGRWLGQPEELRVYNRDYAVETLAYNGADLVNLDIPTYYRRVKSKDLLTSQGEQVKYVHDSFRLANLFPSERERQGVEVKHLIDLDDKAEAALAFEHFYPDTGLDVLKTSRAQKLTLDKTMLRQILEKNISSDRGILPNMKLGKIIRA